MPRTSFFTSQRANASSRDICYLYLATSTDNSTACGSITNPYTESICNSTTSRLQLQNSTANETSNFTNLLNLCSQYTGQNRTGCYSLVYLNQALVSKNASYCTMVSDPATEAQCYTNMAVAFNSSSYCGFIQNATVNQACLENINFNMSIINST